VKIAISGYSGCGNTTATRNVGEKLNCEVFNYTFRNLANDIGVTFEEIHKDASCNAIYDYLTDAMAMRIALKDEIIIGTRLAAWLTEADLRIWLTASLDERARRISSRENRQQEYSYEYFLYKTLKRDEQNRQRFIRLYGIDINQYSDLDLTINTQILTAEQVASLIVAASKWVSKNKLMRKNIHLQRIIKIIAKNLQVPEIVLCDLNYQFDIYKIFNRIRLIELV